MWQNVTDDFFFVIIPLNKIFQENIEGFFDSQNVTQLIVPGPNVAFALLMFCIVVFRPTETHKGRHCKGSRVSAEKLDR